MKNRMKYNEHKSGKGEKYAIYEKYAINEKYAIYEKYEK